MRAKFLVLHSGVLCVNSEIIPKLQITFEEFAWNWCSLLNLRVFVSFADESPSAESSSTRNAVERLGVPRFRNRGTPTCLFPDESPPNESPAIGNAPEG